MFQRRVQFQLTEPFVCAACPTCYARRGRPLDHGKPRQRQLLPDRLPRGLVGAGTDFIHMKGSGMPNERHHSGGYYR